MLYHTQLFFCIMDPQSKTETMTELEILRKKERGREKKKGEGGGVDGTAKKKDREICLVKEKQ